MKRNSKKRYRVFTYMGIILGTAGLGVGGLTLLRRSIPDQVQVSEQGEVPELFHQAFDSLITCQKISSEKNILSDQTKVSAVSSSAQSVVSTDMSEMSYTISYELFGKIPLKTVNVSVVPREKVYVGGTPIGIYLDTDGVYVVETGEITDKSGNTCCPAEHIVKSGDYIQAVNGEQVTTKEELIACIGKCQGEKVILDVEREGKSVQLKLQPVLDEEGAYRAGIWVRNDTQGIGTLTYIDEDGNFGALGHGISDIDTGELLQISDGVLYDAEVVSIVKGIQGKPGELAGIIHYSSGYQIGHITENCKNGLYGTVSALPALAEGKEKLEIAYRQEVEVGPATILTTVDGTCREYEVEIREVRLNGKDVNKGMILEVTDPELLELTGGVIQGMSGSPVIQNGRIVGAVTHVFVNDPAKGYGIFIENMLDAAGHQCR